MNNIASALITIGFQITIFSALLYLLSASLEKISPMRSRRLLQIGVLFICSFPLLYTLNGINYRLFPRFHDRYSSSERFTNTQENERNRWESNMGSTPLPEQTSGSIGLDLIQLWGRVQSIGSQSAAFLPQLDTTSHSWIGMMYCSIVAIGFLWLILTILGLYHLLDQAKPIEDRYLLSQITQIRNQLNLRREIRCYQSEAHSCGATFGNWQPVILLPKTWIQWTESELQAVLLHEMGHISRWHFAWNLLMLISRILFLFHPLVILIQRRLQRLQELETDLFAAKWFGSTDAYLQELAQLGLKLPASNRKQGFAISPSIRGGSIAWRVLMLKNMNVHDHRPSQGWMILGLLLLGLGISTMRSKELFAAPPLQKSITQTQQSDSNQLDAVNVVNSTETEATNSSKIDMRALFEEDKCFAFIKPAELAKNKNFATMINQVYQLGSEYTKFFKFPDQDNFKLTDIEQIVSPLQITLTYNKEKKEHPHTLSAGANKRLLIKTVKPYAWAENFRKSGLKECKKDNLTLWQLKLPEAITLLIDKKATKESIYLYYYILDSRTLIISGCIEKEAFAEIEKIVAKKSLTEQKKLSKNPAIGKMSTDLVGVYLANRGDEFSKAIVTETPTIPHIDDFLKKWRDISVSFHFSPSSKVGIQMNCRSNDPNSMAAFKDYVDDYIGMIFGPETPSKNKSATKGNSVPSIKKITEKYSGEVVKNQYLINFSIEDKSLINNIFKNSDVSAKAEDTDPSPVK